MKRSMLNRNVRNDMFDLETKDILMLSSLSIFILNTKLQNFRHLQIRHWCLKWGVPSCRAQGLFVLKRGLHGCSAAPEDGKTNQFA